MRICYVTGSIWATKKEPALVGLTFLLVEPEGGGEAFAAVDGVGAGLGERVLVTCGGGAREPGEAFIPIDARIVGILDEDTLPRGGQ